MPYDRKAAGASASEKIEALRRARALGVTGESSDDESEEEKKRKRESLEAQSEGFFAGIKSRFGR